MNSRFRHQRQGEACKRRACAYACNENVPLLLLHFPSPPLLALHERSRG